MIPACTHLAAYPAHLGLSLRNHWRKVEVVGAPTWPMAETMGPVMAQGLQCSERGGGTLGS